MKVIVIPDVHLKPWLFDIAGLFLKSGKADIAVCLMDIPDDWNMQFQTDRYRETLDRAIEFAREYPETLWCYGNHEISYLWGKLETGYSPYAEDIVISKLTELKEVCQSKLTFVHRIDNVLFSHGGLTTDFVRQLDEKLVDKDIDTVIKAVNEASEDMMWNDWSPLWLRPQVIDVDPFRKDIYTQVVGHTPVERVYMQNGMISTDVFSTYPDGRQIGESAMALIDTVTRECEKVFVDNEQKHSEQEEK